MAKDLGELTEITKQHEKDIMTISNEIENMRHKMYDTTVEMKQQKLSSDLDSILTKLDRLSFEVVELTQSDAKQEKVLYIGIGILVATQFIGTNAGASAFVTKIFGG